MKKTRRHLRRRGDVLSTVVVDMDVIEGAPAAMHSRRERQPTRHTFLILASSVQPLLLFEFHPPLANQRQWRAPARGPRHSLWLGAPDGGAPAVASSQAAAAGDWGRGVADRHHRFHFYQHI